MTTSPIILLFGGISEKAWCQLHYRPATWEEACETAAHVAAGGTMRIPGLFPLGVEVREFAALDRNGRGEAARTQRFDCTLPDAPAGKPQRPTVEQLSAERKPTPRKSAAVSGGLFA